MLYEHRSNFAGDTGLHAVSLFLASPAKIATTKLSSCFTSLKPSIYFYSQRTVESTNSIPFLLSV